MTRRNLISAALWAVTGFTAAAAWADDPDPRVQYAKMCADLIDPIPSFSCGDGVIVPVWNGDTEVTFDNFEPFMDCNQPALLDNGGPEKSQGQCVPGSRIINLSTAKAQVSVMCRAKNNRPADALLYDEIDVIAHNPASGATCWFQASAPSVDAPLEGEVVPSPTALLEPDFWKEPKDVAGDGCGVCHDNDPFMYSPFVGQVWDNVPSNPLGPYWHVGAEFGFGEWPLKVFDLRDNTCVGCHRIGPYHTSGTLTDWMTGRDLPDGANYTLEDFEASHTMPPGHGMTKETWDVFYEDSVAQIIACHIDQNAPDCHLTDLPGYQKP